MMLWCFPQWDCDENLHLSLTCIVTTIEDICKNEATYLYAEWIAGTGHGNFTQWNSVAAKLNENIQECKAGIKKYSEYFISISLKSDPFTRNETVEFLDFIHGNMNDLVEHQVDEFAPIKSHIKTLKEKLFLLRHLIAFTPMSEEGNYEESLDLEFYVHDWSNKAARVILMEWLNDEQDEEAGEILRGLYVDLLQKATPEFIRLCFGVIKVPKMRRSDTLIFGEFVPRFVDLFLENVVLTLKDEVPMLREGLILLITFLADPTVNTMKNYSELSFIQNKIYAVLDQASYTICLFDETSMDLARGKTILDDFQKLINEVRGKIESLYVLKHTGKDADENVTVPVVVSGLQSLSIIPKVQVHDAIDSIQMTTQPLWKTCTSTAEPVVGFKRDTEVLIDRLRWGTAKVDIVPIVGGVGIGKTTLAQKLLNEPSIRYHFHKRAFCFVSQEYEKRKVLLDLLSELCVIDDEVRQMSDDDDLAHMLYKRLSGYKYLIVMDDIWDVKDWYDVRSSFPDNNNGSRVIFTTRISNISLIAKPDSSPYKLPFLHVDESWELLKRNIFHNDPCPPHLCKVGKLIAKKCRGLPLAIRVVAGLLTREKSLIYWYKIADAITSYASSGGCMDVLVNRLGSCFGGCRKI